MCRVPDSDLDVFETGLVEPFLGLGMDEKPIEWLWPGYVPIGKLTLIEGESASGKSFVAADIAARVSRGQPWPGRIQGPQRAWDVLYVSFEDSREDTLVPRLRMAGANMSPPETCSLALESTPAALEQPGCSHRTDQHRAGHIYFFTEISEYDALRKKGEMVRNRKPVFDKDLVHLEHAIRRHGNVRLVVIDALPTLCPDKKTYRQTLRRLEEIARRQEVAILATARPGTRSRGRPKVEGDKLSEEVRCLFNVLWDPEDIEHKRRFLAPVRMNFTEEPEWLAFRIVNGALAWETPTDGVPLSSCLAGPTERKAVVLNETMNWLREMLKDEDQRVSVMKKLAREWGYTEITLRRAREKLEIRTIRHGAGPGSWCTWSLRPPAPGETNEVPDRETASVRERKRKKQPLALPPEFDRAQINGGVKDLMKILVSSADLGGDGSALSAGASPARRRKGKPSSNGDHRSNGRPGKPR
jgi:KaiC/GvpD/RAD55 family RecA-like ATPase